MVEYAQNDHTLNLTGKASTGLIASPIPVVWRRSPILTGENASQGAVAHLHPFDPNGGGLGAWSVGARVSNGATDTRQFQLGFTMMKLATDTKRMEACQVFRRSKRGAKGRRVATVLD
jgi:hypothetical protein